MAGMGMPPTDSGVDGNDTLLTSPDQETTAFGQEKVDRTFDDVPFSWMGNSNDKVRIDFTSLEESLKMEIRKKTEEDMLIDPNKAEADRKAKGKADALEESEDELEEYLKFISSVEDVDLTREIIKILDSDDIPSALLNYYLKTVAEKNKEDKTCLGQQLLLLAVFY